ncbi:MAG: hypothetical protein LBT44_01835 [Clostridiales bacterium]|jgi:hypothetical protein|nr:hypothetical protein [Clostridiales bacterium]
MTKSKKVLTAVAAVSCAALLATGTFAWTQYSHKVNEFFGEGEHIVIHDDFNVNTGAKDIYVENKSENPVYVRLRLDEFLNDFDSSLPPTDAQNVDGLLADFELLDYSRHIVDPASERDFYIPSWFPPLNGDRAVKEMLGQDTTLKSGAPAPAYHDYVHWIMGGKKLYMPADDDSGRVVSSKIDYDSMDPASRPAELRETPEPGFKSVSEFNGKGAAEQAAFIGWVYDTEDAFCYWSQALVKDDVTGLLLHKVYTDESICDDNGPLIDYYYGIDVKAEAVDETDLPMWLEGAGSVNDELKTYEEATAAAKLAIQAIAKLPNEQLP